jgi:methionine sulfoxide reductase heme-binding subunit
MTVALLAPLHDRRGRVSPLKAATFALLFLPGAWFLWLLLVGGLSPEPNGFVIYNSGVWAMWLLLFSLSVTPARHILRWSGLIAVRRMVGLAGLAYTLFHAGMYFGLEKTTWATVSADLKRLTVIVAVVSTLALTALAVTSFDAAVRTLGSRGWNRIHNLAYPAIGLAMLHFDMGPESLGGTPFVMTGIYFWLMGWRGIQRYGLGTSPAALMLLALASAASSFAFEALWLQLVRGFAAASVAQQLWSLDLGLAETWQVLLLGLAVAGLAPVFNGMRTARRLDGRVAAQPALHPT